jgi:transcriptional regulator with XRE-family HTH domain
LSSAQFGSISVSESTQDEQNLLALGRAIGDVRERCGFSASELAAATGIVQARIQALEAGRLDPDYELLLALADGLGVRPSAFVVRVEELQGDERAPGEG